VNGSYTKLSKIHGLQNSLGLNLLNLLMTTFSWYIAKSTPHGKTAFPKARWVQKNIIRRICVRLFGLTRRLGSFMLTKITHMCAMKIFIALCAMFQVVNHKCT
jgi:hypothetical protein